MFLCTNLLYTLQTKHIPQHTYTYLGVVQRVDQVLEGLDHVQRAPLELLHPEVVRRGLRRLV